MKQILTTRRILAIETSCDETSAAVIEDGQRILANVVASQIRSHMRFGGVVPEVASRHHTEQITQVIQLALEQAELAISDLDAVAVTQGPGLVGALLVGVTAAKSLSQIIEKPLIAVNHLAGHIYAAQLMQPLEFPALALIVSGGHTEIVYMQDHLSFEILGETCDDAIGEAYDKVGRILDLPYPAGKYLDELAHQGDASRYDVPRGMLHDGSLDFSFSGMKSAVMNLVHNAKQRGESIDHADLAASFQAAVVEIFHSKIDQALAAHPEVKQFILAGGVAANSAIRSMVTELIASQYPDITLLIPPLSLCGDNAAMIGAAADQYLQQGRLTDLWLNAKPGLML